MLAGGATASPAQQAHKIPLVGVPLILARADDLVMVELRRGLRARGYVDGENIRIEHRSAEGKMERLPALVRQLVQLNVDVIVAGAEPIVRAAKQATNTIPIVMVGWNYDPIVAGFVQSLNRPGGNITGISLRAEETAAKRLELLRELLPRSSRIAVLYDSLRRHQLQQIQSAARALRFNCNVSS
jgi:putative tryptophan/tyrosine transport system substrate-binding protein